MASCKIESVMLGKGHSGLCKSPSMEGKRKRKAEIRGG